MGIKDKTEEDIEAGRPVGNRAMDAFAAMPVSQAVIKNVIPSILAMLMVLIYNLADTFFIGQTRDPLQVAAVSVATPVFLLFMAFGNIFGIGGNAVISRAMGEQRPEYAKKVSAFCMCGCVFIGVLLALVFLVFVDGIVMMIGASEDTKELAKTYLSIVSFCGPFVMIGNCFSNILRSEGQPQKAMLGMMAGNILNVILDPFFILVFRWNIAGAAAATVIGNVVAAGYYISYFVRGKSQLSISIKDAAVKEGVMKGVVAIGVPAALGPMMMSVSQIIMYSQMQGYGDLAVAGIGVATKVSMIISMVCIGFGQGVLALLGYCVGAGMWERFREITRISLLFSLALGGILTILCYAGAGHIVTAFLDDKGAYEYEVQFARILLTTNFTFGLLYVFINALQAMGATIPSLLVNVGRQGIIYIPALYILSKSYQMAGIVWAQPVADVLTLLMAFALYMVVSRKMMNGREKKTADFYDSAV